MSRFMAGLAWPDVLSGDEPHESDLLIVCAGYEDRAHAVLERLPRSSRPQTILIHYVKGPEEDNDAYDKMKKTFRERSIVPVEIEYDFRKSKEFADQFALTLKGVNTDVESRIWVDVSGLTTYGICIVLEACRRLCSFRPVRILYVEAKSYYPTELEYIKYAKSKDKETLSLPSSLTAETSDVLILDEFSGYFLKSDPTCLILFAGYQKHRSVAVIEAVNPSKVVIVYGAPPDKGNRWRIDMSRDVHEALVTERIRAEEEVSTLDVEPTLELIEKYYDMLCDDHNICICSNCSKMQTVAVFLAWERNRDVQLAFPLPMHYLPRRSSKGSGRLYQFDLPYLPGLIAGAREPSSTRVKV